VGAKREEHLVTIDLSSSTQAFSAQELALTYQRQKRRWLNDARPAKRPESGYIRDKAYDFALPTYIPTQENPTLPRCTHSVVRADRTVGRRPPRPARSSTVFQVPDLGYGCCPSVISLVFARSGFLVIKVRISTGIELSISETIQTGHPDWCSLADTRPAFPDSGCLPLDGKVFKTNCRTRHPLWNHRCC
jgi:hypothetical protein